MTAGLQLGRPGIYQVPVRSPDPITVVRLDVAGFVGVALRGPVDQPTPVISWADYQSRFGGLEVNASGQDRMLPYAVQAFFAQGGSRAVVVRVAAADGTGVATAADATAAYRIGRPGAYLELGAADEGDWGSRLQITLDFQVSQTMTAELVSPDRLRLPGRGAVLPGSLLRISLGGSGRVLRWACVLDVPAERGRLIGLDRPLPVDDDVTSTQLEVITGVLETSEKAPTVAPDRRAATDRQQPLRRERIDRLGLHPCHPRHPATVLAAESLLLTASPADPPVLVPDPMLTRWSAELVHAGQDRSDAVGWSSFFDDGGAGGDPLAELPAHGVDLIGRVPEVGILCVPDLGWRAEPADVVARQHRVVEIAEFRHRFVALLDVPAGLPTGGITSWRAGFDSTFAGAYLPWLGTPRGGVQVPVGRAPEAVRVPPSAYAAGIMADRERRLGLARGPANQLAVGAVRAADVVTDEQADALHQLSINVFASERDGFRLSAGRTLAADQQSAYRQLSVRRLVTMIALTLQRYGELLVFEPHTEELRDRLTDVVTGVLRGLHRDGAFAGRTEDESFFVRCDETTNPPRSQALGRLVAEVGIAPAAPLEFLVLRIAADGEGGVLVSERTGGDHG